MNDYSEVKFPEVGSDGLPLTPLAREFYTSEQWFKRDMENIFRRRWLFVCHISEIPEPGDYVTFNLADESIVVARDRKKDVHAFHNVCRHRGARICQHERGNASMFVCPFHSWTYNLDGSLRGAPHMPDIDKSLHSAKKVWCDIWNGMVFINLMEEKPKSLSEYLREADFSGHQLDKAKVIASKVYPTKANWKINAETYQECYHCTVVHGESLGRLLQPLTNHTAYDDIVGDEDDFLIYSDDLREGGFLPGVETESWDGQYVTKRLLGDEGNPQPPRLLSWFPSVSLAAFADFAFIIDWIPVSATETIFRTRWLVHQDAVEGQDYEIEEVIKMADTFNVEDKVIVEQQQLGVNSSAYVPGPYHAPLENDARKFIRQYIKLVK